MMLEFEVDADYAAMVSAVFARWSDSREAGEHDSAGRFDAKLWAQLAELGLTRLTGPEANGGSGAGWAEAATLHRLAGYHAIPLPLVEHDLIAGWLIDRLDLDVDSAVTSIALEGAVGPGLVASYGRDAERLLVLDRVDDGWALADLRTDEFELARGTNIAGEPRDRVTSIVPEQGRRVAADLVQEVRVRGALARAVQLCGALDRAVELAAQHAAIRQQFGRPLLKFQAVQALLADAAAETALAQAATQAALTGVAEPSLDAADVRRAVTVAKSCTSHAAGVVSRNTHQVLGAIGTTTEHSLHLYSRRLLSWRDEYGTRDHCDRILAEQVLDSANGDVWSFIVAV
jgi:acyl-CoA dehydrogenase